MFHSLTVSLFSLSLLRLYLSQEATDGSVSRSRSSEALRRMYQLSPGIALAPDQRFMWRRSRSLSDTEKTLDEAIKNLERYMNEEFTLDKSRHRHYSSNDSAMGESEAVLSPLVHSEPSTLSRNRQVFTSMDSAFSNNSSQTNSSEGMNTSDFVSCKSDSPFSHTRMSSGFSASGVSGVNSISPTLGSESPELAASPQLGRKGPLCSPDAISLPSLSTCVVETDEKDTLSLSNNDMTSAPVLPASSKAKKRLGKSGPKRKWKLKRMPSATSGGTFSPQRSPILNSKQPAFRSDTQLDGISSDHTPTQSTTNITISVSGSSWDDSNFKSDEGTII